MYVLHFQSKIWMKPAGEQSFLYGNHILKSGLGRITENTPQYQGVIVYCIVIEWPSTGEWKKTVILKGDFVSMYQNGMEFLQTCENIAQLTL